MKAGSNKAEKKGFQAPGAIFQIFFYYFCAVCQTLILITIIMIIINIEQIGILLLSHTKKALSGVNAK